MMDMSRNSYILHPACESIRRSIATVLILLLHAMATELPNDSSLWAKWWTYKGISGPNYWGILNPKWRLCKEGRRQSPVNIESKRLLYDPSLKIIRISSGTINGAITNNGNDVLIKVLDDTSKPIYVSKGPLSYQYRVFRIHLHFAAEKNDGSEHRVNNLSFPVELQIVGYNSDLYRNWTEAETSPHGLVAVAIFLQIGAEMHKKFNTIARVLEMSRIKGRTRLIKSIHLSGLLHPTSEYITYDGSQTQPGCHETVTWVIMNKPIYISQKQINMLRGINGNRGETTTQIVMERNNRRVRPLNGRPLRTNIYLENGCRHKPFVLYQVNQPYNKV